MKKQSKKTEKQSKARRIIDIKAKREIVNKIKQELNLAEIEEESVSPNPSPHSPWGFHMDITPDQSFHLGSGGILLDHPDEVGGIIP